MLNITRNENLNLLNTLIQNKNKKCLKIKKHSYKTHVQNKK